MRTSNIDFEGLPPPIRRSRRQLFAWFTLFWSLTAAVDPAPASITLAQGQASPYCIHFSPSAPDSVKLAAAELQTYFAKATGITLPLSVGEAVTDCPVISLGLNPASRAAGLDLAGVPDDGFRIVANGADVYLLGVDTPDGARTAEGGVSVGTLNATYTFLEDYLDIRWLMPGEVGEYVPKLDKVEVPSGLARLEKPTFASRRIAYIQNDNPLVAQWLRRQKQGSSLALNHDHAWHELIPPPLYQTHPEWFAMIGGFRAPPTGDRYKLETTNPELVQAVAQRLIDIFRQEPERFTLSISPTDSEQWSSSRESVAYFDTDPHGHRSVTPLVLSFYANVAHALAQVLPEKKLCGYIYSDYLYPPSGGLQSLPDSLCLVVAPDFSYGYGLYRPELRLDWERVVAAWQSSRQLRAYYDLPTVFFPDIGGPQPLGLEILSFIYPRVAAAGYRGIYIYGAAGWGHGAVTNYILAKLNWDAGADVQKLANEFFRWAYGPDAGEKVSRLYALVDDAAKAYYAAGGGAGEAPDPAALRNIYAPILPDMVSLLQRAQETAAKPQERLRLEMLRLSFAELSRLLGRHGLADADASPPEITRPSDVAAATTNRRSGFALALSPRATPDADKIAVIAAEDITGRAATAADGSMLLRGSAKAVLLPSENGRVEVAVSQLATIGQDLDYIVYSEDQRIVAKGRLDRDGALAFDGQAGRPMLLKIDTESSWYHLDIKGARFALSTTAQRSGIHFIGRFPTVYFHVPPDLGTFRVTISSDSTEEPAAADLIDLDERTAGSLDTSGRLTAQALADSGSRGGYWRLQWKRPWLPHMHNVWVQLDERLPPWVVVSPPQALEVEAAN
jgi:hypothetical protein